MDFDATIAGEGAMNHRFCEDAKDEIARLLRALQASYSEIRMLRAVLSAILGELLEDSRITEHRWAARIEAVLDDKSIEEVES
jgi:hypothetical protein